MSTETAQHLIFKTQQSVWQTWIILQPPFCTHDRPSSNKYLQHGEGVDSGEPKTAGKDKGSEVCAVEALQAIDGGQDWQVVSLPLCLICQQVVQWP